MGISLPGLAGAEAWSSEVMLGLGWHDVTIAEAEEGKAKTGSDQLELRFSNAQGGIRDWLTVSEKTLGKVAQLYEAAGIDRAGLDTVEAAILQGKRCSIFVGEERDNLDPSKMRTRVKAYAPVGKGAENGNAGTSAGPVDTSGFGGGAVGGREDEIPF